MKKALIYLSLAVMLTAGLASTAKADISFTFEGKSYTAVAQAVLSNAPWHGGAFEVTVVDGSLPTTNPFKTFCVESQIFFTPGTPYYASIDTAAVAGEFSHPYGASNPLTSQTAWIYSQYVAGNLSAYSDQEVSQAIWFQMDQTGGVDNMLSVASESHATDGIGNVRVLNLWTLSRQANGGYVATDVQSQLIQVPAPAAVLLGAMGLGLVSWLKKRFA